MKKQGRRILFLVISLCLISGCKRSEDELVMVTEAGFAPYEYYENGEIVGVDIEIGKEIAKAMNKTLLIKDIAFDSLVSELKSGKADFAAAGMSITEERKKQVDFTIEYTKSNQVVVVRRDSTIQSFDDLKDKRISVQLGSIGDTYATKNYKKAEINRQKKFLVAAEAVKNNKSDCIIMDQLPAEQLVAKNDELMILPGILFQDAYGMAVKKGNSELLQKMNEVLKRLMDEGKIEEYIVKFSE